MLFVTFHGGSAGVNNVYAYDETAKQLPEPYPNVLSVPSSVALSELRALTFANGYLYVANGSKKVTDVLCFRPSSEASNPLFNYVSTFASNAVNSLAHPFGFCFDTKQHAYVSSQDTNVVTQFNVAANFQTGSVVSGNAASYLKKFGAGFLDGTFVASHQPAPGYPGTPKVKDKEGGLDFALASGSMSHSVRDVAISNGVLCVADEAGKMVKMYDLTSGAFLDGASVPAGPIHLLGRGSDLYVGAGSNVYTGSPAETGGQWTLKLAAQNLSPALPGEASGMCFDGSGNFYVAARTENEIYQYGSNFQEGRVLLSDLPDNPEFVVWQASS